MKKWHFVNKRTKLCEQQFRRFGFVLLTTFQLPINMKPFLVFYATINDQKCSQSSLIYNLIYVCLTVNKDSGVVYNIHAVFKNYVKYCKY